MCNTLEKLAELIEGRKSADTEKSYVATLFKQGTAKIAQKVGEEATETVIAAVSQTKTDLINESADLLFHLSVLWADRGVDSKEVMAELEKRMGISGLDEKALRTSREKGKI